MSTATASTAPASDGVSAVADALEADGITPVHVATYTKKEYWDARFAVEVEKDWLCRYADVALVLEAALGGPAAARARRILLVGSGNSSLPADMAAAGYEHVRATDISPVAVEAMRARVGDAGGRLSWAVEDMQALSLPAAAVDAVLDKAALDALLAHGGDVWRAEDEAPHLLALARTVVDEAHRVLAPGGVYICITFSQPHFRRQYLRQGAWAQAEVKRLPIDVGFGYSLFYMVKEGDGGIGSSG